MACCSFILVSLIATGKHPFFDPVVSTISLWFADNTRAGDERFRFAPRNDKQKGN
jgi:hypothetical protein